MLSGLATWVQDVIESLGYLGVAILVIVENLFPPIPSEIVLPFAGFDWVASAEPICLPHAAIPD
jgi:membrane protein DedA with SNARE-associated domain